MNENGTGIVAYGLTGFHCQECGRPKLNRMYGVLTGCPECDEAVTRHRCHLPDAGAGVRDGARVTCGECGSAWVRVTEREPCYDCCGECGHMLTVRRWEVAEDKRREGPRRDPPPFFAPFRNLLPQGWHRPERVSLPSECTRSQYGFMVHVKPGCTCPRR